MRQQSSTQWASQLGHKHLHQHTQNMGAQAWLNSRKTLSPTPTKSGDHPILGAVIGGAVGTIFGPLGTVVGAVIGGFLGSG